jgi:hypothetical protein
VKNTKAKRSGLERNCGQISRILISDDLGCDIQHNLSRIVLQPIGDLASSSCEIQALDLFATCVSEGRWVEARWFV